MADNDQRRKRLLELLKAVRLLSGRLGVGQAYEAGERYQVVKYGERLYTSYASFRSCKHYHRKQNQIR
jgi:hypothetical protein